MRKTPSDRRRCQLCWATLKISPSCWRGSFPLRRRVSCPPSPLAPYIPHRQRNSSTLHNGNEKRLGPLWQHRAVPSDPQEEGRSGTALFLMSPFALLLFLSQRQQRQQRSPPLSLPLSLSSAAAIEAAAAARPGQLSLALPHQGSLPPLLVSPPRRLHLEAPCRAVVPVSPSLPRPLFPSGLRLRACRRHLQSCVDLSTVTCRRALACSVLFSLPSLGAGWRARPAAQCPACCGPARRESRL